MPIKKWVETDAWRGHYDILPTAKEKLEGWRQASRFDIVPHEQNEEFFNATRKSLSKRFNVRIYTAPTSNVFSVNKVVFLKPKNRSTWTREDTAIAKRFDDEFSDTYGWAFSVMSGTTSPIDVAGYKKRLDVIVSGHTRKNLEKVA
jgi:hypothetical protein